MDWSPILISMRTAGLSIVFTFFMGILAAWMVVRISHPLMKTILDGIFTIPLVLPPTVAGFFLLYVFGVKRPVGQFFLEYFSIKIAFSWGATVLAAVVMSFPLMYRSARGAFEQVDDTLVQAARTLGMGEWTIFRKVLLANAVPGVVSGGVLAFARGLGEFGYGYDRRQYRRKDQNSSHGGILGGGGRQYGSRLFVCGDHCGDRIFIGISDEWCHVVQPEKEPVDGRDRTYERTAVTDKTGRRDPETVKTVPSGCKIAGRRRVPGYFRAVWLWKKHDVKIHRRDRDTG